MTYSCGIFKDLDGDLARLEEIGETNGGLGLMRFGKGSKKAIKANGNHGKETETDGEIDALEEAQLRKIRHIIKKADIKPGHRVLEIGSGWGSFAIEVSLHDP
jgi:cyclopropane-fatty-acyl-phospholipid synthase